MEKLFQYQNNLLKSINKDFQRYLCDKVHWSERFVGIKGLRGVGKTTLLLQHLKYKLNPSEKHLYVSLDHPYFYNHLLYDLALEFSQQGGKTLLVDEVHKMPHWSRQIKNIYDSHPDLQLIFTASSSLDIYRGESDLSRRVLTHQLHGMSFREYLLFNHGLSFPVISLPELLNNHIEYSREISSKTKPLLHFKNYLQKGYLPFGKDLSPESCESRLIQTLEVVFNEDLSYVEGYSADKIFKIKKLLGILAESVPFTVNVSAIANKLGIGRNTLLEFLYAMEKAGLLHFLHREGKGVSTLQKPDKIYLENTNMAFALKSNPNAATLRELFVINQLKNAGATLYLPDKGDVKVQTKDVEFVLEIGGKSKTNKQVKDIENSYLAIEGYEYGYQRKIPIYLFGFLY